MHRNYFNFIIAIAAACAFLAIFYIAAHTKKSPPEEPLVISQPISPFKSYISGVGIVEASSNNIFIGTPINRVVDKINVKVGDQVKTGDVLFNLESRDLSSDLLSRRIAFENSIAQLQKLEALPRKEEIAFAKASLKISELELAQKEDLYQAVVGLIDSGALSKEEINRRRFNFEQAQAQNQQAQANFDKTIAGTWKPDLKIAQLEVLQSEAAYQRAETDIERTIIRSPINGTILQVKVNEGEFPPSDSSRAPAMIIGNIDPLHLRVSINQFDVSNFSPTAPAVAFLQGNAKQKFPLKFVRIEPYFVAKQNLTNDITEKVDTRVLQVIYCFTENDQRIFVGQQMDVFIETE